jgi:hypothetical protein
MFVRRNALYLHYIIFQPKLLIILEMYHCFKTFLVDVFVFLLPCRSIGVYSAGEFGTVASLPHLRVWRLRVHAAAERQGPVGA